MYHGFLKNIKKNNVFNIDNNNKFIEQPVNIL